MLSHAVLSYTLPYVFMQQGLSYFTEKYRLREFRRDYKQKGLFEMMKEYYDDRLKGRYLSTVKRIWKKLAVPLSLNINFMPERYSVAGSAAIGTAYRIISEKPVTSYA